MNKQLCIFIILLFNSVQHCAQELFPNTEPASTMPKGVLAVRWMGETYKEVSQSRNQFGLRLLYGLNPRWTIWAQAMFSNHHGDKLPNDLLTHVHIGNTTRFLAQQVNYGRKYPYLFSGLHFFTKYRFLTLDGDDKHFRMAGYAEYSAGAKGAHDESEPHLQGDNNGLGFGLISTYLKSRLALSLTLGYVMPRPFSQQSVYTYDEFIINPDGTFSTQLRTEVENLKLNYPNALIYNFSIGYLLYPRKYKSYQTTNINFYIELMGKAFPTATFTRNGERMDIQTFALKDNHFLDTYAGFQFIFNSNTRVDISMGFETFGRSFRHFYPIYSIGLQRNIFFK